MKLLKKVPRKRPGNYVKTNGKNVPEPGKIMLT